MPEHDSSAGPPEVDAQLSGASLRSSPGHPPGDHRLFDEVDPWDDGDVAPRSGMSRTVVFALLTGILFVGVYAVIRRQEAAVVVPVTIAAQMDESGELRPQIDEFARLVRAQRLVTTEIHTTVVSTSQHENWRGRVTATVESPVKHLYGVDLAQLDASAFAVGGVSALRRYRVTIPRPERIGSEVVGPPVREDVEAGGMRFKSRSGEYYLRLAHKQLPEEARRQILSPEQQQEVEEAALAQVEDLLTRLIGKDAAVDVRYAP